MRVWCFVDPVLGAVAQGKTGHQFFSVTAAAVREDCFAYGDFKICAFAFAAAKKRRVCGQGPGHIHSDPFQPNH